MTSTTVSPNGKATSETTAVPTRPANATLHGSPARRARTRARSARSGIRMPNCGFTTAASAASAAARSVLPRISSEVAKRRSVVPTESTCPQTAEVSQMIGVKARRSATPRCARADAPRSAASRTVARMRSASARIAGSFTSAPGSKLDVSAPLIALSGQSTQRYPGR